MVVLGCGAGARAALNFLYRRPLFYRRVARMRLERVRGSLFWTFFRAWVCNEIGARPRTLAASRSPRIGLRRAWRTTRRGRGAP